MDSNLNNRMETQGRKRGRPSNEEVAARDERVETETVAVTPNRQMVLTLMKCCGRWERPSKLKDFPEYSLIQCPGCGKKSKLFPTAQQVL